MLRSDLCDYSDAYIVVKGTMIFSLLLQMKMIGLRKMLRLKIMLRSCISKINITLIDNAEDLDIVMPMYIQLEYSQNYSMTSGKLWNYYRDKIDDVHDNASDGKSFNYKTKIVGKTP